MSEALYGESGFYRRTTARQHFRTSPNASLLFAAAILRLARQVDEALGRPDPFDLIDVGAGDAGLLTALAAETPTRWRLTAVEIGPRHGSPVRWSPVRWSPVRGSPVRWSPVRWRSDIPRCTGMLIANEWLDNVPCNVVQRAADGLRLVLTDDALGPPPTAADAGWVTRWWPLPAVGDRAEVGRGRDEAWANAVASVSRGVAVAIDYAHNRTARPPAGTLTGYRSGRQVPPVADGSCDLTAHVALDACAAAACAAAEVTATRLTTQREALRVLGVDSRRPVYDGDPLGYLRALSAAGEAAELRHPGELGGFGWLVQSVRVQPPTGFDGPDDG
jgi:SAM-dependent MidA family methyltransferase